jgi:crotonobetainyl-CoA:carnitine CoA-transferase CaiB-like acyl-CoA transferase
MSYATPYEGIKIVDLSQGIAGPYCAMLLAQYGADVVKIEPPEGDWTRHLGRPHGDHTAFSVAGNLGKRSVVLDLKSEEGKQHLWHLIDTADVLLEGYRPGVMARLGFDYESVKARNERIVYVSVSGFGQRGPLSEKPAMDPVLQAFTGFMTANSDAQGVPQRCRPIVVDMSTALYTFQALSAALFARQHETTGRRIEVSLMEAATNLQCVRMMQSQLEENLPDSVTAPAGIFRCRDGGHVFIVVLRQDDFVSACGLLDLEDLANDKRLQTPQQRYEHRDEVNANVAEAFLQRDTPHWLAAFTEAGIQNEAVLDYSAFLEHPHVRDTECIAWLHQPGFADPVPMPNVPGMDRFETGTLRAHAPTLGEHTEEVLSTQRTTDAP